jgi:hypothetical protein
VILSRFVEAAVPSLLLSLGLAAVASGHEHAALASRSHAVALGTVLVSLAVSHHAAVYGLLAEARGGEGSDPAAYPFVAGVVGVLFALLVVVHPALAILYPVLYAGFGRRVAAAWDRAEVHAAR